MTQIKEQSKATAKETRDLRYWVKEALTLGVMALCIFALRSVVGSNYVVPTGSMIPSILPGDRFIADQRAFGWRLPFSYVWLTGPQAPERGDIVVFPSPVDDIDLVKRVVAVQGDVIEVRESKIILNGTPLPLEQTTDRVKGADSDGMTLYWETLGTHRHLIQIDSVNPGRLRNMPEFQIPPGQFFAMGDNRDHSGDSRYFGPVEINRIRGRAMRIFFSAEHWIPRFERFGLKFD